MCSSSSISSMDQILMEIDIAAVANKIKGTTIVVEDSHQNQKNYFLVLPAELLEKIFTAFKVEDHDALQNMTFTSKHMHTIVKPYLMALRKEMLDEFYGLQFSLFLRPIPFFRWRFVVEFCWENCLKRVLRTNMELTCKAHNLPIEQLQQQAHASAASVAADVQERASSSSAAGEQAHAFATSGFIKPNSPFFMLGGSDDQLGAEQRAYQLFQFVVKHHCQFSKFYKDVDLLATKLVEDLLHMNESNTKAFKAAFAYRIFKKFLHANPVLSMFTDVHWPEEMPEDARRQMAMHYAKEIEKDAPDCENGSPSMDEKYRIRIKGGLGNPSKPLRIHHYTYFQNDAADTDDDD